MRMLVGRVLAGLALAFLPAAGAAQMPSPLQVVGFTNLDYWTTEGHDAGGFRHGELSVLLSAPLAERLAFFSEISAHGGGGGGHGGGGGLSFQVMRALLRYDFTDYFKLSAGRYHPTIGYWPMTFHHGVWLETTATTPSLFDRHEGALPGHFLGVRAEGNLLPATVGLSYTAGVGNGRGLDFTQPGDAGDANDQRAFLASVSAKPPALFGLRLGGAFYHDRVSPSPTFEWDEQILSAHVAWERETPELIAEYVRLQHDRVGGRTSAVTEGYYAQLAYRLPGSLNALKPYARIERLDVPLTDSLMAPLDVDYRAALVGVRYDFADYAALKGEYRDERRRSQGNFKSFVMQVSLTFGSPMMEAEPVAAAPPQSGEGAEDGAPAVAVPGPDGGRQR